MWSRLLFYIFVINVLTTVTVLGSTVTCTLEWLTPTPGLGDGELEFVDVGVVESLSENLSSSWGGDVVDACNDGSEIINKEKWIGICTIQPLSDGTNTWQLNNDQFGLFLLIFFFRRWHEKENAENVFLSILFLEQISMLYAYTCMLHSIKYFAFNTSFPVI